MTSHTHLLYSPQQFCWDFFVSFIVWKFKYPLFERQTNILNGRIIVLLNTHNNTKSQSLPQLYTRRHTMGSKLNQKIA